MPAETTEPIFPRFGEEQIREILDSTPDAMVIVDAEGRIQLVNLQTERLFGYARDELVGRRVEVLVPARLREVHEQHRARYRVAPAVRFMGSGRELLALRKDGTEFPVEVSLSPLQTGEPLLVCAAIRDVTARKQTEAVARLAMNRLVNAVENVQQAFAIFDAEDRLVLCNSAFRCSLPEGMSGPALDLGFEHLLDLSLEDQLYDLQGEPPASFKARRLAYRKEAKGAFDLRTSDGRHWRVTDRRTSEGGTVTTIWDLTDDLRRAKELAEARALAEAASAAKSEFLASMSHELRTPLNAILGFAQLLERDRSPALTERQLSMIGHVIKGGEHLLSLINEVLDLSRIESGTVSLSIEPVPVDGVLEEVADTLAPMAARASVELSLGRLPEDLPPARADRTRLAQILMNLGSNAIKYNRPEGRVSFEVARRPEKRLRVTVTDTGVGIPEDKQGRVFQPFQRAGQETGPIEGTGIGLTITKRLAEKMGGSVGFRSRPGEGSTFWVELQAHVEEQASDAPKQEPPGDRGAHLLGTEGPRFTVLYVEDNPSNQAFMEALLSSFERVRLMTAPTAEIGVELARHHLPDLVILDINLPGMSGYEALRLLKEWEETRGIPVFALSASAMERDVQRALGEGFSRYLTKPVSVDVLMEALEDVLIRRPASERP